MSIDHGPKRRKNREKSKEAPHFSPTTHEASISTASGDRSLRKNPEIGKNNKSGFSGIHYTAAAAAMAVIGYLAYRGNQNDHDFHGVSATSSLAPTIQTDIPSTAESIPKAKRALPQFEFSPKTLPFEIPADIHVNPIRFDQISAQLGHKTDELIKKLALELAAGNQPHVVILHFLNQLIAAAKQYPELAPYIEKHMSNTHEVRISTASGASSFTSNPENFNAAVQSLERLFPRGGYLLRICLAQWGFEAPPQFIVSFHKIKKPLNINVSYEGSAQSLPLYEVDQLFSNDTEGDYGVYFEELDLAIVHDDKIKESDRTNFITFQEKKWLNPSLRVDDVLPEIVEKHLQASLFHEATHIFIGKNFKKGKQVTLDNKYGVSMKIPVRGLATQTIDGEYYPIQFQEVAAVGIELIHADPKWPFVLTGHMNQDSSLPESSSNYLVKKLLPLVTIDCLPDSPERERIINTLQTKSSISSEEIYAAIFKHWNSELASKIGGKMAVYGFRFFQDQK